MHEGMGSSVRTDESQSTRNSPWPILCFLVLVPVVWYGTIQSEHYNGERLDDAVVIAV